MRNILALAAALSLAACGGQAGTDEAKNDTAGTPGNSAAAEPPATETAAATPAAGKAPTKEFMVGKWGQDGDCALAVEFKADGSMVGPVDRWELNGAELTMVGLPQKMILSVVDDKTMESRLDGKDPPDRLTRC